MATTTNYSWTTPNDTDLVKNGASAIRTHGSAIDTTTKNLNPSTTLGDIEYRSATANTNTRLAIGTTGQVLTVAGGVPSWATPTTGDIEGVTAGTGISGGGTSGTVTITNSMATAIDAKGDLVVGTGADTFARLAVGTNGHTLVADSAETTGLKWQAPAGGGGMTLISRTSFSNVASQAFNGVFTSTYDTYFVNIDEIYAATASDDLLWQFQYSTSTVQTSNYYSANFGYNYNAELVNSGVNNGNEIILSTHCGGSGDPARAQFYINGVGNTDEYPVIDGLLFNNSSISQRVIGGEAFVSRTYTGFKLKSASTNITGTVSIFGVNKS